MTNISTDSMRSILSFMTGRMCSTDVSCWIDDDGHINMKLDNLSTTIKFIGIDSAEFYRTVESRDVTVKKTVTRPSEFNGALIEFINKPIEYFEEIIDGYEKCPNFYKQYSISKSA